VQFCTNETSQEDIELLLRRFIRAKPHGRGEQICCLADVHNLTYTQQCFFVDKLRHVVQEYGTDNASTFLLLSGR
jgi:hypothetical protein